MEVASAHLTLDPHVPVGPVLTVARERLRHEFHIEHATLQVEPAETPGACQPVSW
jgi:cobalt-zinc-cadmium efflux system protein